MHMYDYVIQCKNGTTRYIAVKPCLFDDGG